MITNKDFNIIRTAFSIYEEQFNNHSFTYTYVHRRTHKIENMTIQFSGKNFMHLCGVTYKNSSASHFYSALRSRRVSLERIQIRHDGTTGQKLQVLELMEMLIAPGVRVCDNGSFYNLRFDKAVRTGKMIIALTCVKANEQFVPQSLLSLSTNTDKKLSKSLIESHEVIKLERYKNNTTEAGKIIFEN